MVAERSVQKQRPLKRTFIVLVQDGATQPWVPPRLGTDSAFHHLQKTSRGKTDISEPSHYHKRCNQNKKMTIPAFIILILPSKSLAEDRRYNWILKSCENTAQIFGSDIQEKSRAV